MGWNIISPWRVKDGSGQTLSVPSGASATFANAIAAAYAANPMGGGSPTPTYALALSALSGNCMVRIDRAGTAASATNDFLVKATDPPYVLKCSPGDKVSAWGLGGAAVLYLAELTQ